MTLFHTALLLLLTSLVLSGSSPSYRPVSSIVHRHSQISSHSEYAATVPLAPVPNLPRFGSALRSKLGTFPLNDAAGFVRLKAVHGMHTLGTSARQRLPQWEMSRELKIFIAGAVGAAVAKTVVSPIEVVKMNMMVNTNMAGMYPWQVARTLVKQGGIRSFWKGNGIDVLFATPSDAIRMSAFDIYKRVFQGGGTFLAAAAAGVTGVVVALPAETIRTRLSAGGTSSFREVVRGICVGGGMKTVFKGLVPSVVGVIPYAAIKLGSYDKMQRWYHRRHTALGNGKAIDKKAHIMATLGMGAAAAMMATSATFWLEVVRRRMMMGTYNYANMLDCILTMCRTEGVGSLFRGMPLSWMKMIPSAAFNFAAFEMTKDFLLEQQPPLTPPPQIPPLEAQVEAVQPAQAVQDAR